MDLIEFKVVKGTKMAQEVEEWKDAVDPALAKVEIEYLPKETHNQNLLPVLKLTMEGGYTPRWYKEEEFSRIMINYVKINWSGLKK